MESEDYISRKKKTWRRAVKFLSSVIICLFLIISFSADIKADNTGIFVNINKSRGRVYDYFRDISKKTGLLFIYDSQYIENGKPVKLRPGKYLLDSVVKIITGKEDLVVRVDGKYVLLFRKGEERGKTILNEAKGRDTSDVITEKRDSVKYFHVGGKITDRLSGEPVYFATIGLTCHSLGTVSNLDGEFLMNLPDSLRNDTLKISHIGYEPFMLPLSTIAGMKADFSLNQKIVPLQEIVVRVVDPIKTIREMLAARCTNYAEKTTGITFFYREGIEYGKNMNIVEAVLSVFKTGIKNTIESEQVKMLKMRRVINPGSRDTLLAKVKSSIYTFQQLDIIKNLPDFIDPQYLMLYDYHHTDITSIDDRRVLVISFAQKEEVTDVLYKGDLYIDAGNKSLVRAKFELNPEHIRKATDILVLKKNRSVDIVPAKAVYDVDYKYFNGKYYINHIRGDLTFRVRKKGKMGYSDMKIWFEAVNCHIEDNPQPVPQKERISVKNILSETYFSYDPEFWGNFITILPEEDLIRLIEKTLYTRVK
jgi:hypothetical protein